MNVLVFLSFLFFIFKYDHLIFLLLGIEFVFFILLAMGSFFLESMSFFYFLCFGVISSVTGLMMFFFSVKSSGMDKVMF